MKLSEIDRTKLAPMMRHYVELKDKYPIADKCIYKAMENVNIECVLGYKKGKDRHSFLDDYD